MGEPASGIPAQGPGRGGPASGRPAQPFDAEYNALNKTTHGAHAPRVYAPLARELAERIVAERPYLSQYPEAVASWATAEARCDLLRRWLAEQEILTDDGVNPKVSGALKLLSAVEHQADKARQRLGLDPRSDLELARARAEAVHARVDLEGIIAAGREALARRAEVVVVDVDRDDGMAHGSAQERPDGGDGGEGDVGHA